MGSERASWSRSKVRGSNLGLATHGVFLLEQSLAVKGTDHIEIDTSSLTVKWITVVVIIGGLDRACDNIAMFRIDVPGRSS